MQRRYPFERGIDNSLPPWRKNQSALSLTPPSPPQIKLNDSQENWQRYRRILGSILDDLDKQYENYRNNLESHPKYKMEKTVFWRENYYKEDPYGDRFENKWIPVWLNRLNQFYEADVRKNKDELKYKLKLPFYRRNRSPSPARKPDGRQARLDEYLLFHECPKSSKELKEAKKNERYSKSPDYANYELLHENDDHQEIETIVPLSVLSVLRDLIILEEELGNHGPKALELFARSESFEKQFQLPSNELLKEVNVFTFFNAVKEKLEIQLKNERVNERKVITAKASISNIEALLDRFAEYLREDARNNQMESNIGLACDVEQYNNPELKGAFVNNFCAVKNNLNLMSMPEFSLGTTSNGIASGFNKNFYNFSNNKNFNNKINSKLNVNDNGNNLRNSKFRKTIPKGKYLDKKNEHKMRLIQGFEDNKKFSTGNTNNFRRKFQISGKYHQNKFMNKKMKTERNVPDFLNIYTKRKPSKYM